MTLSIDSFAGLSLIDSTKAEKSRDAGKFLIHGPQGTGKTHLASTLAQCGPMLYIDLVGEHGTGSFAGEPYAENIYVARPKSVTELDDIYWQLDSGDHPFVAVAIDSLSALQKMVMRFMMGHSETAVREIKQGAKPATFGTWGEALNVMTDTVTFWYGLAAGDRPNPIHVAMTAQTKVTESDDSGVISRNPDVQKGALQITLAAPDYVIYTDLEPDDDSYSEDGPIFRHIARFGADTDYRTKAIIPAPLRGRLPSILGRKGSPDLSQLVKILGMAGAQPRKTKK